MNNHSNNLIQLLPQGRFDVIGDVHGEYTALSQLVENLGYDSEGNHPQGRYLVFIGDLCDRGLNSPDVLKLAMRLVYSGRAFAVLGNHEINLLAHDVKDGSGWFFQKQYIKDLIKYGSCAQIAEQEKQEIVSFLSKLPIALIGNGIRIIHACWDMKSIELLQVQKNFSVLELYQFYREKIANLIPTLSWYQQYLDESKLYQRYGHDPDYAMPLLRSIQEYDLVNNQLNPINILISGHEKKVDTPFFIGGRWRFTNRVRWWDQYVDSSAVIFGHYWRLLHQSHDIFSEGSLEWLGKFKNAFCNDYSVGARWRDRKAEIATEDSQYHLAALQWPEKKLVLDTGETYLTG